MNRLGKFLLTVVVLICVLTPVFVFGQPVTTKPNTSNTVSQCLANVPLVGNGVGTSAICHATGALGAAAFLPSAITVNGATCTLGGSCSPSAGAIAVGDAVTGGTNNGVFFNSAGSFGNTAAGTNGQIFLGVTSGNPAFATMSGGASITNAGVVTILTNANLTGAITSSGNATSLGSFTSANLLAALTDETGTGVAVFGTSPTIATPVINGLPTGTGVATANTASTLVARDGSGNFAAGTVTASLTGHASLDLALTGGTMSGAIAMGTNNITGVGNLAATTINGNTFTTGTGTLTLGSVTLNAGAGGTLGSNAFTSTAYAPLASPTFTGTPAAPTAAVDTNTTQLATTAMVLGQAASATPLIDGTAAVGTSTRYARGDHVHPTDTTRAPLASPTFTGTVTIPTGAALGTPASLVGTNLTGTGAGFTAGTVTTNANLTGAVTSSGNATSLGSFTSANLLGALTDETGTGPAVFAGSPTFTGTAAFANTTNSGTIAVTGASTLTGNVGIGGANASGAKLEVNSAIQVTGGFVVNAIGLALAYQGSGNSTLLAQGVDNSTNGTLVFQTSRANGANGVTAATATFAGITLTTLSSDTATADSTLCARNSDNLVLKGTGTLGICLGTSGAQFKTAFAPMVAGIDDLMKINFQNYRYRDGFGDGGERMQYGTTAQDVERAMPDLVRHDASGMAINYDSGALLFVGLRSIQQIKAEVQQLKADNDNLRVDIEVLLKARGK